VILKFALGAYMTAVKMSFYPILRFWPYTKIL